MQPGDRLSCSQLPQELIREVAIGKDLQRPKQLYKRVGATRLNWVTASLERAHAKCHAEGHNRIFNCQNIEHVQNGTLTT